MNQVTYEIPRTPEEIRAHKRAFRLQCLLLALVLAAVGLGCYLTHHTGGVTVALMALGSLLVGANTVTYEAPVTGTTAPTALQSKPHNVISAVITGDGAATTFTITHNWGLTTAQLAGGVWPDVEYEYLLAAGYTAAATITSKTANTVVFGNTAFTGAGLRVKLKRPIPAEVVIAPQP